MSTRFSFTFLLTFSIFFNLNCAFPSAEIEYEELLVEDEETAFNDTEIEAMMRIHPLISMAKTTNEQGELMHELCQVLGSTDEAMDTLESPGSEKIRKEWELIEQKSTLSEEILFWREKSTIPDIRLEAYATRKACFIYNNAYKTAPNNAKPDAYTLFLAPNLIS